MTCPFSSKPCIQCAIYRGRHHDRSPSKPCQVSNNKGKGRAQSGVAPVSIEFQALRKVGRGTATSYSKFNLIGSDQGIVGVASPVAVELTERCKDARIVLSNAGVIPIRAKSAEKIFIGKRLGDELLDKAAEAAAGDSDPVSYIHASEEYRRHLIRVLTKRMAREAWEEAIRIG